MVDLPFNANRQVGKKILKDKAYNLLWGGLWVNIHIMIGRFLTPEWVFFSLEPQSVLWYNQSLSEGIKKLPKGPGAPKHHIQLDSMHASDYHPANFEPSCRHPWPWCSFKWNQFMTNFTLPQSSPRSRRRKVNSFLSVPVFSNQVRPFYLLCTQSDSAVKPHNSEFQKTN